MFKKNSLTLTLIILCFSFLVGLIFIFSDTTHTYEKNIILSDYLIISTENTFESEDIFIETYNNSGNLVDSIKINAPLAWHTDIDNGYISIYGSSNYFIIDTNTGNIINISAPGFVEDSCIIDDCMFFMTNNGVSKENNTYQSNLCFFKLNNDTINQDSILSIENNTVPCGITINDNKLYYLCSSYDGSFNGSELFLEEYDFNFNLLKRQCIEEEFSSLLGIYNNNIIISSIGEYLFYPSMIKVHTPISFDRFSISRIIGKQFIRKTYSSFGKEVWIENINDDFSISSFKLNLKNPNETLCNIINKEKISTHSYQNNSEKIYFFNIVDNSYDPFEYRIKDNMKVIGAYSLKY